MKGRSILYSMFFMLTATAFLSCSKEEAQKVVEKPTVLLKEVGTKNSRVAYAGQDLHLDAEVIASEKIAHIKLQITRAETNYGWDFIKTYTEGYAGLKNAEFHEHVDVPDDARPGIYTVLLIATDERGEKSQDKVDFEVLSDPSLPLIKDISVTTLSLSVIHVSGQIQASNRIKKLEIEVQSSAWTKIFSYTGSGMVGQTAFDLDSNVDISGSPTGHYHVNVTITDQLDKYSVYSFHFDK